MLKLKHLTTARPSARHCRSAREPALAADKIVISNWDGYMPADLPEEFPGSDRHRGELPCMPPMKRSWARWWPARARATTCCSCLRPLPRRWTSWAGRQASIMPRSQHGEPLCRSRLAGPRSGQHIFSALCLGHHRPVLSVGPGEGEPTSWNDLLKPAAASRARSPCWRPTAG